GQSTGGVGAVTISSNGTLQTGSLWLGKNNVTAGVGGVMLTNGGTLEANFIQGGQNGLGLISGLDGILQFSTNYPLSSPGTINLTNAMISFRGIADAPTTLLTGGGISNVQFSGGVRLKLMNASNSLVAGIVLQTNSPGNFSGIVLAGNNNA